MARTVEDVLREMDEKASQRLHDAASSDTIEGWLEVLRPVLAHRGEDLYEQWNREERQQPDIETFPIKSGLPQRLLRDLGVTVELQADHEGTGQIRLDYSKAPPEHRLQALLSVMGAVGDRIAYAMGNEAYVNLLRGIVARREREL